MLIMEKEITINDNFLNLLRDLINEKLGIYISEKKNYLLESKINKLLKHSNYKSVAEFYFQLKNGDKQSLERLIYYITTNHTFFYRENTHLRILKNDILIKKLPEVYIWCAASSTGEEVYSIIIELLEQKITNFLIIATDINKDVLFHMKKGRYNFQRMKYMPPELIKKYFIQDKEKPDFYFVKEYLKKFYITKIINLVDNVKFEKKFDYIFCRNVLIYFDKSTQIQVVKNLFNNLDNNGYLFVGHSESLMNICNKDHNEIETVFSSVYSKKQ